MHKLCSFSGSALSCCDRSPRRAWGGALPWHPRSLRGAGCVRSGPARLDPARLGPARLGPTRPGPTRPGRCSKRIAETGRHDGGGAPRMVGALPPGWARGRGEDRAANGGGALASPDRRSIDPLRQRAHIRFTRHTHSRQLHRASVEFLMIVQRVFRCLLLSQYENCFRRCSKSLPPTRLADGCQV